MPDTAGGPSRHADDEPSRAFDLVLALLSHPNVDERGIELRRSLQDIHPGLLERYLAKRTRATTARPISGYSSDSHVDSQHAARM